MSMPEAAVAEPVKDATAPEAGVARLVMKDAGGLPPTVCLTVASDPMTMTVLSQFAGDDLLKTDAGSPVDSSGVSTPKKK
jgi:hypothetical protein